MLNKRLIGMVSESKRYIAGNVLCQWISLVANLVMMVWVTNLLASLFAGTVDRNTLLATLGVAAGAVVVRCLCTTFSSRMGYLASSAVKKTLREKIYGKLLRLGSSYQEKVNTSEVVQVAVEGVDQLETYFGSYLPQLFYAVLAPVTLFVVLAPVSLPAAVVLLVCVPLIPVAIVAVQRWAKKLLARYWGQYTALGDSFLENLQGLTTLKIYQADGFQQEEMNRQAEKFRKITMKVLTMQLNSITIMDLIAYGGAALGMILSVTQYQSGQVTLAECLLIIVLAADFFLPMRLLGSYFHIAMNGMAASEKIFRLLDLPEAPMPEGDVLPGGSGGAPWHQPGHSCGELHGHRGGIWLWKIYCGLDPDGAEPGVPWYRNGGRPRALPHPGGSFAGTRDLCGPSKLSVPRDRPGKPAHGMPRSR